MAQASYDPTEETFAGTVRPHAERKRLGGATGLSLLRRLEQNRLSVEDEALVARAKAIREGRRQAKTYKQIATELGLSDRLCQQFAARGVYNAIVTWLEQAEAGTQKQATVAVEKEHKATFRRLIPVALQRLEAHLYSGIEPATGKIQGSKLADNAMEMVMKGSGLLDPEGSGARPIIIDKLIIQQEVAREREDDAAIETTCTELAPT